MKLMFEHVFADTATLLKDNHNIFNGQHKNYLSTDAVPLGVRIEDTKNRDFF